MNPLIIPDSGVDVDVVPLQDHSTLFQFKHIYSPVDLPDHICLWQRRGGISGLDITCSTTFRHIYLLGGPRILPDFDSDV